MLYREGPVGIAVSVASHPVAMVTIMARNPRGEGRRTVHAQQGRRPETSVIGPPSPTTETPVNRGFLRVTPDAGSLTPNVRGVAVTAVAWWGRQVIGSRTNTRMSR